MFAISWLILALALPALATPVPAWQEPAPGVRLLPGTFEPGRQPDGNSVLLRGREGWVVVDSGRHAAHSQALLDAIAGDGAPLVAVVNSHWHLDHVAGNPRLRAAHPRVSVHASLAIDAALGGFLADYRAQLAALLAEAKAPPGQLAEWRDELARIDAGPALRPDVPVTATGPRALAGRDLQLGLETRAASGGDVWLLDPASRTLVAGDLVTLPVPFLDTACPSGWREALARLEAVDFDRLVPGHGPVLDREGFRRYRHGFGRLLDCAGAAETVAACSDRWLADLGDLVPASQQAQARDLLAYYLGQKLAEPAQTAAACAGG